MKALPAFSGQDRRSWRAVPGLDPAHTPLITLLLGLACNAPAAPTASATRPDAASEGGRHTQPVDARPPAATTLKSVLTALAQPTKDAITTESGLAYQVVHQGRGRRHPSLDDVVTVTYLGWTPSGEIFDRALPSEGGRPFLLGATIKGWQESLRQMLPGERRRLWLPGPLAYDDAGPRSGAPRGPVIFDLELLKVKPAQRAPRNLNAPPRSARRTSSGLVYAILKRGKGHVHPRPRQVIVFHHTGWTADGRTFDSSRLRGAPEILRLESTIPGLREGLALMTVGEKARFWVPSALAHGDRPRAPGVPAGPLVVDIELLATR